MEFGQGVLMEQTSQGCLHGLEVTPLIGNLKFLLRKFLIGRPCDQLANAFFSFTTMLTYSHIIPSCRGITSCFFM